MYPISSYLEKDTCSNAKIQDQLTHCNNSWMGIRMRQIDEFCCAISYKDFQRYWFQQKYFPSFRKLSSSKQGEPHNNTAQSIIQQHVTILWIWLKWVATIVIDWQIYAHQYSLGQVATELTQMRRPKSPT